MEGSYNFENLSLDKALERIKEIYSELNSQEISFEEATKLIKEAFALRQFIESELEKIEKDLLRFGQKGNFEKIED
jgi:exodeoxyribonuclease VII small subunit